jgi:hypothetical protein
MNTNNSGILKKIKIISGHAYWDQEKLFDEKTGNKNLVTLSLKTLSQLTIVKVCSLYEVLRNFV